MNVSLIRVEQTRDPRFANFTSVLTLSIEHAQEQNISSISCGDPGTTDTVQIDALIMEEFAPADPIISGVTATYQSRLLRSIEVVWKMLVSYYVKNVKHVSF